MEIVDIYNKALAAVGCTRFLSSPDATFAEAVHCRREWEAARLTVLGGHEWGWLAEEVPYCDGTLIESDDGPTYYQYARPATAIAITAVMDVNELRVKWHAANSVIYSQTDVAKIRYVPDSTTIDDWPIPVQDAVALELAARIAFPLKQDKRLAQAVRKEADVAFAEAVKRDSKEVRYGGTAGNRYINSRL